MGVGAPHLPRRERLRRTDRDLLAYLEFAFAGEGIDSTAVENGIGRNQQKYHKIF